jgi:hypothetical protein
VTQHARIVLADCEEAMLDLIDSKQNSLRRRWFTAIGLLRAVGHVLDKVDAETSPAARVAVNAKYAELKAGERDGRPAIFWQFIERERNNILKVYRFAVRGNLTIRMPPAGAGLAAAPGLPPGSIGITTDPLGAQYTAPVFDILPLDDGPFIGRRPDDVLKEAIAFWKQYLDEVDRITASKEGA